ncbi:hypothetical protein M0Q50_07270 [bacterium]|jgi:hypothetical protein|nr:hypothetical protein [bacterium]
MGFINSNILTTEGQIVTENDINICNICHVCYYKDDILIKIAVSPDEPNNSIYYYNHDIYPEYKKLGINYDVCSHPEYENYIEHYISNVNLELKYL